LTEGFPALSFPFLSNVRRRCSPFLAARQGDSLWRLQTNTCAFDSTMPNKERELRAYVASAARKLAPKVPLLNAEELVLAAAALPESSEQSLRKALGRDEGKCGNVEKNAAISR